MRFDVVDGLEELCVPGGDELLLGVRVFADCVDHREVEEGLREEPGFEVRVVSLEDEVRRVGAEDLQPELAQQRVHGGVVGGAQERSELPARQDAVADLEGEVRGGAVSFGVVVRGVEYVLGFQVLLHERVRDRGFEVVFQSGERAGELELADCELSHEVLQHEVHFLPD